MVRGSKGKIESADDIFELPSRLDTTRLAEKFDKILCEKKRQSADDAHHPNVYSQGDGLHNGPGEETPALYTHAPQVMIRNSSHISDSVPKPKTLLQALHSAFGWEYYSLGILKLLADGFGFAGPILLNLLVTYIEEKKYPEPEFHGYLYACGLLLSTFLGTICSTQFDYHCQVGAPFLLCIFYLEAFGR
jgi:ATP-binding cassette subfamily C (CFTR/MRP) protein 10